MTTFTTVPTVSNGDSWSAAQQNTYLRDNMSALWPFTTAGDLAYASAANALSRLGIGSARDLLRVNSGGNAPEWGIPILESCVVYKSSNQSVANNTNTALTWDSEVTDVPGWHDPVTNNGRITVAETGIYIPFVSLLFFRAGGTGTFHFTGTVLLNGSDTTNKMRIYESIDANGKMMTFGGIPLSLAANDYMQVQVHQDSGASGNIYSGSDASSFAVVRVG